MGSPTTSSKSRTGRHLPDFEQRAQESKVRVEDDVAAIADESFSPVFLRNATAFGFSPRLRADIVLNNLVGHAVLTGDVRVLSDGTPWRPLVHARDIVSPAAVIGTGFKLGSPGYRSRLIASDGTTRRVA